MSSNITQCSQFLTSQNTLSLGSQDIKAKIKVFKQTLRENGIELSFTEEPHTLNKEQSLVVRDLEKYLENSKEAVECFVTSLKLMCNKEKYFRKALTSTQMIKNSNGTQYKFEQESLFRIFLKVDSIHTEAANILLDEITSICSDPSLDPSWLRLLLNTLRYLPFTKEPEQIAKKLLDILEISTRPVQFEILDTIPEIMPDSQAAETIKQLCKLLDDIDKDELTGAIIDCLNALDMDNEMRAIVQENMLDRISSGASLEEFPVLLTFIMSEVKAQISVPVLLKIRNALDSTIATKEKTKENETSKILIFNKLQWFTLSPKVSEAWINMISSIKSHSDHKPIDYLIMFMLHNKAHSKRNIIEAIFKKRVHTGLFKIKLLEKMFEEYMPQQLLKDYFESIVNLGCTLITASSNQIIKEFSLTLFQLLFHHEYTDAIYRREILNSLIILTGASDKTTASNVLSIISSFLSNKEKLQQHIIILMILLEQLDKLEPSDIKIVFDILCGLTCGPNIDNSMSGVQNEIFIVVRKQLGSPRESIKYRGIISAVVMARNIARISENDIVQSLPSSPIKYLSDLPRGPAREAGDLLELAYDSCTDYPDLLGLYYDQLASMLITNCHLDKYFLAWLYESITADFRKIYVMETIPQPVNDIEMSLQFILNNSSEVESPMGINIGGLTLNKNPSILVLAPYFRLLRLLHYRQQDGNLSTIDALLGCAVILPKFDDIDDLESQEINQIVDCYFHCANWFRELISGFVTQKDKKLRKRVVKRLKDLLEIENTLKLLIQRVPDHKFPASYFDSNSEGTKTLVGTSRSGSKGKNPKKKAKSAATVELHDTAASTSATQVNKKKTATKTHHSGYKVNFRDLDTDVVLLLKYPLKLPSDDSFSNTSFSTQACETTILDIEQLKFLLKDLVAKLVVTTQSKNAGMSHLNEVIPLHIMTDIGFVLPNLNSHLKVIIQQINELLEKTEERLDLPEMFTTAALDYKTCFGLIIEALLLIFSWTGFQHSSNLEVLKNMLRSIRSTEQSQTIHSAHGLIIEFINRLAGYTNQCLELHQAVHLIKTMQALYSVTTTSSDVQKKIVAVSEKLLSKRWYNQKGLIESGRNSNLNIDVLVKTYLSSADVKTISGLVGTLQEEIGNLNSREDCLLMLSSIDKQNFHVLYNGLCCALLNRIKTEIESLTNNQHLDLWYNAALTMQGLMTVAKIQETKINLACFLKISIGILKIFLSQGIPIMEIMLRSKPDEVVSIFKTIQISTRFLHHLCCYTKLTKDASLITYVPQFRLTLESLVYRVKAALAANNCSTAFWMGNLRNRDLHGEDILSQSTVMTDNTNEGSEEELPLDDSDDDILNQSNDNRSDSSAVFD